MSNIGKRIEYVNLKFNALIAWGMYTWRNNDVSGGNFPINTFAPTGLDVDDWLDACVAAKMKCATLTVKELDGFCLYPTTFADPTYSPYAISSTNWYINNGQPDITRLFVDGCRARGLKVGVEWSARDMTHEVRTGTDHITDPTSYYAMIEYQLTELLTNYGDFDVLWVDGWWSLPYNEFDHMRILDFIKTLQPNCVLPSNDQVHPNLRWEIEVYEVAQPGGRTPAGNTRLSEDVKTMRIDGNWYYHILDDQTATGFMTAADIVAWKATTNSRTAIFTLGIQVDRTGHLPAAQVTILNEVGALL